MPAMKQIELEYDAEPSVEPEVRACVASLVSALGGPSAADNGRYVLGDDALAVLKDIKRWLKLWDEKTGRLDVARTLAESNLVKGDLLEILAQWPEDATESAFMSKIALLCIDLLTILTWPISTEGEQLQKTYRYKHIPSLQRAQAEYKQAILHHDLFKVLRTAIRAALPAMAQTQKERSPMEDNIIKVVLYLFRNIAMIAEPEDFVPDDYQSDISRSSTIDAFHYQDIFSLILTVCSSMTEEFRTHDLEILETVFYLVKGVDVERLFMDHDELVHAKTTELQSLISKEKAMLASYKRNGPSRHNRFGTMVWLKREDGKATAAFGQRALKNEQQALEELDQKKKWKRPTKPKKKDEKETPIAQFDKTVPLTSKARNHLRDFVAKFLDSSFNPLMFSIRRAIEREENNLLDDHKRQYFYLISWFLRAETARRKKQAHDRARRPGNSASALEAESYSLVASVLNQETFVLLQRTMVHAQEQKIWLDLNASMKCFTQILLTVQDMTESPLDEDQEIAENILNRIFYEQSTHDIVVTLLRTYDNQGFGYLDACTQLAHTFCRLLENYAKQNVDLQVRSRRRARKKDSPGTDAQTQRKQNRELEAEDVASAERTSTERRFDFAKFAAKYVNQQTMNTFVAFLRFYKDFNPDQLKRAHRFFYRAAFKMEQTVYLFRLDIIALLNKLIKGPAGLDDDGPMFKDWSELVRQVFRRLTKKMEERPALAVELLFSKIPATTYFLEHGYDREVPVKQKRAPAELEVKPGMELEEQIGVVVSILINQGKADVLAWVKDELNKAATERKSWLDLHTAQKTVEEQSKAHLPPPRGEADQIFESVELRPSQDADTEADTPRCPSILFTTDNTEHNKAMANDKYVRLLLTTLLFQRLGEDSAESPASWIIPSSLSVEHLTTSAAWIAKFEFAPPTYDDDKGAEDFVRRKAAIRARPEKESDVSDSEGASDVDGLFADNLPDQTRAIGEGKDKTKPKRKRLRHKKDELLDASVLDARRAARQQAEAEKSRKIKSALYVHASDDDSDEEADRLFFAAEEERRKKNNLGGGRVVKEDGTALMRKAGKGKKKRKSTMPAEDDQAIEVQSQDGARATKRRRSTKKALLDKSDDAVKDYTGSDSNHDISQMSSPEPTSQARSRPRRAAPFDDDSDEEMRPVLSDTGDETDTPPSSVPVPGETSRKKQQTMETESDAEVDIIMDDAHTRKDSDKENEEAGGSNGEVLKNGMEASAGQRGRRRAGFVLDDDSDDE